MKRTWKRGLIAVAAVLCLVCLGAAIYYGTLLYQRSDALRVLEQDQGEYDPRSIVLQDTNRAEAERLAKLYGAELRITKDGSYARLTLPEGVSIRDVYARQDSLPYIGEMSADYQSYVSELTEKAELIPSRPQFQPNDSDYALQTYLDYMNLGNVWEQHRGENVRVAVIDTGIDTDHPEFSWRISDLSYNATEDKVVRDYGLEVIEDEQGHGTAVAGVIAASMNSVGVVGIAPNAELIVIKAECDSFGSFLRTSDLVFGLYYAIEQDAYVVNMSFGGCSPENLFAEATQLAWDSDIICVAAAGNSATAALSWPAADPNVIGVGAIGEDWALTEYSNYGENTNLVAPGTVYTTQMGGGYQTIDGTSFSSPIVAASVALFMRTLDHYPTTGYVWELLFASCRDLGTPGRDYEYGFGVPDVAALIQGERGTVTFDMLTDEVEDEEMPFIRGIAMQELPEPERLYAVFDGWYYDDAFTQEYQYYEDVFQGDLTLYAKWANEDDGIPYTYAVLDDGTVEIRSYTGRRRFITIPEKIDGKTVSAIGDFAFENQTRLRQVNLPSGLKTIGRGAFKGCSNLTEMRIPANVTILRTEAFKDAIRLRTLIFASGSKLETLEGHVFENCSSLDKVDLPASVQKLDGSDFLGTISLTKITVASGNSKFSHKDGVLFNATGDTLVAYPAARGSHYTIPKGTTQIGSYAFGFAALETVDLTGLEAICEAAFINASLREVTIPDSVGQAGAYAFAGCIHLHSAQIGSGITLISNGMFKNTGLETIEIPAGIVEIGEEAFTNYPCAGRLKEVTFAEGSTLEIIGKKAFHLCALEKVVFPASLITIGESAFAENSLQEVRFADGSKLASIERSAFLQNRQLRTISLPEGMERVKNQAFWECDLRSVTIPASVFSLGGGVFGMCDKLEYIQVAEGNTVYHSVDGVLLTKDNTVLHTFPSGKAAEIYEVPETVRRVEAYSFAGTGKLENLVLPEGLEILVDDALHYGGFITLSLPSSLTEIGEYAIAETYRLEGVHIPDNVTKLGRYAFTESNAWSVTFGSGSKLPRIGAYAFAGSKIREMTVPANVSSIAQYAFAGCEKLEDVIFAENSKLPSISAYMFDGCENLRFITFQPGSKLTAVQAHGLEGMANLVRVDFGDAKVTNIDNFAFRFCASLENLTLPDTVTNIGRYAFYGCESLAELSLPGALEHIGGYAFLGTKDLQLYLKNETMPPYLDEGWDQGLRGYYTGVTRVEQKGDFKVAVLESGNLGILEYTGSAKTLDLTKAGLGAPVTVIGGSAFRESPVTEVVLPDSLTTIQAEAFAFSGLKSVTVPANVEFIGREAFRGTPLTAVTFQSGSKLKNLEQNAFRGTEKLKAVSLPASLTTMGTGAFRESGLETVTFASGIGLETIPQMAFADTQLKSVALPDKITLVDHNAFHNVSTLKSVTFGNAQNLRLMSSAFYHTGLETLTIPANVTYIGEYCFSALGNLKAFKVDAANPNYSAVDGLLMNKSGSKLIAAPAGRTGSLTIPTSVEEIGFGALEESKLSSVILPQNGNLLTLGSRAFFGMPNLKEIAIPDSVISVDYYAFGYCENLETVTIGANSRLVGIYEGAFIGDAKLKNIQLPSAVAELSDFAFYGCTSMKELPLQEGLKGVYDYAFAYTGLAGELAVPKTVTDIGDYAFMGNDFTVITIPDDSRLDLMIGLGAFEDCHKLEKITLPFIGAGYEDMEISWLGYIFGAANFRYTASYIPESLRDIVITEGITSVGKGGLAGIPAPVVIHLPHSITKVYNGAFHETSASYRLTNVISSGEGWSISPYFSEGLSGKLTLAEGIKEIWPSTFENCALTELVLPDSLTTIHESAIINCENLTVLHIPRNLKEIHREAFFANYGLEIIYNNSDLPMIVGGEDYGELTTYAKVIVDKNGNRACLPGYEDAEYVRTSNGFLFRKQGGEYALIAYTGNEPEVMLPDSVNGESYKVAGVKGITRLVIPESWTVVSGGAFSGNMSLFSVTFPEGIKEIRGGFYQCKNLFDLHFPDSLEVIEGSAFEECWSLSSIHWGTGLKEIGSQAFRDCVALKHVSLPSQLERIEWEAFDPMYLESITLSASNRNFRIVDGVLYNAECTAVVAVPKNLKGTVSVPEGVTEIRPGTFQYCKELECVRLPASVQSIGTVAFPTGCAVEVAPENTNFRIHNGILYDKNLTEILYVLQSLTGEVVIPGTVTEIPNAAFEGCTGITALTIPGTVKMVGMSAFRGCSGLKKLTLGKGVETLCWGAFMECTALEEVAVPGTVKTINSYVFEKCTSLKKVVLEEGITEVGAGMFGSCKALTQVELPSTLKTLCQGAFSGCVSLESIDLPEGLTTLESGALSGTGLKKLHIPDSVTTLERGVLTRCAMLEEVKFPASLQEIPGYFCQNCVSLKNIEIPKGITRIGEAAFSFCSELRQVTLPASLTQIDEGCFGSCVNLKTVMNNSSLQLESGSQEHGQVALHAETIIDAQGNEIHKEGVQDNSFLVDGLRFREENGTYILCGYEGTENSVTLPLKVNGKDYTIQGFYGANYVTLPDGMTEIPEYAFANCNALLGVTIPDTVRVIGSRAFYQSGLRSIRIPGSVETIEEFAFFNCNISSIELSEGLVTIEYMAFGNVPDKKIDIPSTVRHVGEGNSPQSYSAATFPEDGLVVKNGWLIQIRNDVRYLTDFSRIRYAIAGIYQNCTVLKNALWGGGEIGADNVETVLISNIPESAEPMKQSFALKHIVIMDSVKPGDLANLPDIFTRWNVSGVTIFVEGSRDEYRWDDNFPGWHNGNRVVYGDDWAWTTFYDENGEILLYNPRRTAEVIRRPAGNMLSEDFIGWDLNGDDEADHIPAVMTGDLVARAVVAAHEHSYTETVIPPECLYAGYTLHTCRCGDSYQDNVVPATGHKEEKVPGKDPSCSEPGFTEGVHCTVCGFILEGMEPIPEFGHDWQDGGCARPMFCARCGFEQGEAAPHTMDEVGMDVLPDCVNEGYTAYYCMYCEYFEKKNIVPALGHTPETLEGVPATCTREGLTAGVYCTCCGDILIEQEIAPALGHSWQEVDCWSALCCERCGVWGDSPLGHKFGPWELLTEPTCYYDGERGRWCDRCGDWEYELVPMLEHSYQDGMCVVCGEPEVLILPGDANGDGKLNYRDALMILRCSIGLEELGLEVQQACDMNGDGKLNYRDALTVLRISIGLE